MYEEFYGLVRPPFEMTPDPGFLVMGDVHREGLATLVYGVRARKGFVLLTGEVGTGKTTLLHALLGQLDQDTASAFIFNPRLEPLDFFRMVFDEFGLEDKCETKAEYLLALNRFLISRLEQNLGTLLIIDEAQNLSPEMLEEVRLLSNLETPHSKLIQIMLVGQPGALADPGAAGPSAAPPAHRVASRFEGIQPRRDAKLCRGAPPSGRLHGQRVVQAVGAQGDSGSERGDSPSHQCDLRQRAALGLCPRRADARVGGHRRGRRRSGDQRAPVSRPRSRRRQIQAELRRNCASEASPFFRSRRKG